MRAGRLALAATVLFAACEKNTSNPPTTIPPAICDTMGKLATGGPPAVGPDTPLCTLSNQAPNPTNCMCADYHSQFPAGVFDFSKTNAPLTEACKNFIHYAWPECGRRAGVSGIVARTNLPNEQDDDNTVDLCPDASSMVVEAAAKLELRTSGSFTTGNTSIGRIHVEVQDCRYFDEPYQFNVDGASMTLGARPAQGDLLSVFGGWVADDHHDAWTEIHEARLIAVAKPVRPDKSQSMVFVSASFAAGNNEDEVLTLDVAVPKPANAALNKLSCALAADAVQLNHACPPKDGVRFEFQGVDSQAGTCRIQIRRDLTASPPPPNPIGYGCFQQCGGLEGTYFFAEQNHPGSACKNLGWTGAIRAEWTDPGDLWLCRSCQCADPSASGATVTAPVQGCALLGLNPADPVDQQRACAQVCGGNVCSAAGPSCHLGACAPPASGGVAELVAEGACDPTKPSPAIRVLDGGDYRVTLDHSASSVTFFVSGGSSTTPLAGTVEINSSAGIVEIARFAAKPDDFTVHGTNVSGAVLVTAERLFGNLGPDGTTFTIPAGVGVFGVRGLVDGTLQGINVRNPQGLSGTFDVAHKTFALDVSATEADPDVASPRRLTAHLVGTIDNVPPHANAGGPQRVVECTTPTLTPVTLDGRASSDPDPGDHVSHYQWFNNLDVGVGNQALASVALPQGDSPFVLHVYDDKLGSSTDSVTVKVVDTTPPTVTAPPMFTVLRCGSTVLSIGTATGSDACDASLDIVGRVVTSNGTPLSPPIAVVNGQVRLGKGAYTVQWTASDGLNTSALAVQNVVVNDPLVNNVRQLPNGDMRYAITFPTTQAYVEAFARQNGVQNVSGNIVNSRVANGDGTFTYSRTVPASQYHAGDVISVRFYSYRSGMAGVFTPGPLDTLWFPDFVYGAGTDCIDNCHPKFVQRADGSVRFSATFSAPQTYVEAFVRRGTTQIASGNIVANGVTNADGTYTYSRLLPRSSFQAGDVVTYRFYSYISGHPAVFAPGPTQNTWFPAFTYGQPPASDCPTN